MIPCRSVEPVDSCLISQLCAKSLHVPMGSCLFTALQPLNTQVQGMHSPQQLLHHCFPWEWRLAVVVDLPGWIP